MRVNVYAEELTDKVEILLKNGFVGVRFYLELPVQHKTATGHTTHRGPFIHKPGDDDSAAVTFFAKTSEELVSLLQRGIDQLEEPPQDYPDK